MKQITSYKLFLDDVRMPKDVFNYIPDPIYNSEWVIVRNYDEFVKVIEANGLPELLSFDHDLADEHYDPSMYNHKEYSKLVFKEKTGYDCAKWVVEFCMNNNYFLCDFKCHSMNPAGKKNIITLLENFRKFQKSNPHI